MTIYNKDVIRERIRTAEPYSPIAVFDTGMEKDGETQYDAAFADTAIFKLKRRFDKNLIGVFHKYTPKEKLAFLL